ncbi:uncharacterized protein FFB20_02443 [Fusarium fujikuroi]|nr:uncharacterized protein FFB20_02443 [Fusarium fujikuroi]SCN82080.1 uncharacterized protein FFE2_04955 [Fusarium fujikuroi]SCN84675.1 uncharacterized protein FFM5_03445 [Fusarium fujikuroi]SCN84796.1 uncharacterized protein FFC1_04688 [Fusarium fujikuroi]SCO34413.1 uncharacterized protein FFNC_03813 [Fusarium fujikuroi]
MGGVMSCGVEPSVEDTLTCGQLESRTDAGMAMKEGVSDKGCIQFHL